MTSTQQASDSIDNNKTQLSNNQDGAQNKKNTACLDDIGRLWSS